MNALSLSAYWMASSIFLFFSIRYLAAYRFRPYQREVIGKDWEDLEPGVQSTILIIMRLAGGGFLACATSTAILAVQLFYPHTILFCLLVPVPGLILASVLLLALTNLTNRTGVATPRTAVFVALILLVWGLGLSIWELKH